MANARSESRQRTKTVTVRLTPDEKTTITAHADARRVAPSAYMRDASLRVGDGKPSSSRKTVSTSEGKAVAIVLACLGTLMDKVSAYASRASMNEADRTAMCDDLRHQIMVCRDRCFTALRRKP